MPRSAEPREAEDSEPRKPEPAPKRKLPLRRRIDVAKRARDRGESYETPGGKWMPQREQRPPCTDGCRLKCSQRLSSKDRLEIFQTFWSIADHAAQWNFIARNMRVTPKEKCTTVRGESRRSFTRTYYFQPRTNREQVCKTMFLNTLGISNAWVATVCKKLTLNGFVSDDGRGKIGHRRKKLVELV
ncbi:PREDICTED: uncharacterized protein LOC105365305 [Ceratosolen solmsi marchali]|uniref:Uncharacterized protein LOC105365305 n=1 Tax=Ceratosolen solmsi marchali TaxID=326594 RepID=A0AAJ7DZ48_9HYME|nr:PREDICTED: uncharacterized protein LOC105365305 [Ceratosolen solmsi marchali]